MHATTELALAGAMPPLAFVTGEHDFHKKKKKKMHIFTNTTLLQGSMYTDLY